MKTPYKILITLFIFVVAGYTAMVGYLYFNQRDILYNPITTAADITKWAQSGAITVDIPTSDGLTLHSWYWQPADKKPVILLFHGNSGNIESRAFKAQILNDAGYGVLLAEYRGFGGNNGDITQDGLYEDAHAHLGWLNSHGIETQNVILYGESLGTGVATYLAAQENVKAVILEAPYTSIMDVAAERYPYAPVRPLLKDKFMSIDNIVNTQAPVLIVHGTQDTTVPLHHGEDIFKAANDAKTMIVLNAGHNDLYDHGADKAIINFLSTLEKENTISE